MRLNSPRWFGQGLDRHRLGEPRHALDEQMPLRQYCHEQALEQPILANDDLLHLVEDALHERSNVFVVCFSVHRPLIYRLAFSLKRRHTDSGCRILNRYRKANADKKTLGGRIKNRGDDPDNFAPVGYQRPAGAAGIGRGIELDKVGQHAFTIRRVKLAAQSGDDSSTRRRAYTKRIADGDNLIAYGKVRGGAHGSRNQIIGNLMRLKHGQIMLRLDTGHRGFGFEPVSKHDLHPLGAEYHMKIGQDHALVDDDDPGADAFFVLFAVLVRFHSTYSDDRRSNDLVRFRRRGRQNIGLERVQHCSINIFLSDRTRRRRN